MSCRAKTAVSCRSQSRVSTARALHPIEGGDRLVPDQDRPPVIQRPRHRGALLLAARQFAGFHENFVGQVHEPKHARDLVDVAAGRPGEHAQVVPGRAAVEPAHIDVVEHRQRFDQRRRLRDEGDPLRNALVEEVEQGRLAGPRAAHHGDALAGADDEIDIAQHRMAGIAGACHAQFDRGRHGAQPLS